MVAAQVGTAALTSAATAGLMVFLVAGELAGAKDSEPLKLLGRNLRVFGIPLVVVFATIVIVGVLRAIT